MKATFITSALALPALSFAWSIQFVNISDCSPATFTSYTVYSGTGQSECNTLGASAASGEFCGTYFDGGNEGPDACTAGFTTAASWTSWNGTTAANCIGYTGTDCGGTPLQQASDKDSCNVQAAMSFTCNDNGF